MTANSNKLKTMMKYSRVMIMRIFNKDKKKKDWELEELVSLEILECQMDLDSQCLNLKNNNKTQ